MGKYYSKPPYSSDYKRGLQNGVSLLPSPKSLLTHLPRDPLKAAGLLQNVTELAEQEVIVPVPVEQGGQGVYSHIFVVPKPSERFHLIINLKLLNTSLCYEKF